MRGRTIGKGLNGRILPDPRLFLAIAFVNRRLPASPSCPVPKRKRVRPEVLYLGTAVTFL